MKRFGFFLLLLSFFLFYTADVSAKIAIVGFDSGGPDEFAFTSDVALPAGTVIYFTEDHYDVPTSTFGTVEGMISYVAPAGGLPAGRVVIITELSNPSNRFTTDDGGTTTNVAGNWSLSGTEEEIYAFTASNPAAPESSVTLVYCWFLLEGTVGVGSDRDPRNDGITVEVLQDWNNQMAGAEYRRARNLPTTLTDILDANNWAFNESSYAVSSTDFTGSFVLEPALPVTLTSFTVSHNGKNGALLNWKTVEESQNEGFEIERSDDERAWTNIGFVDGHGESDQIRTYDFIDENLTGATYFYRLRQMDYGGAFTYSPIVGITLETAITGSIEVFPNPVFNEMNVRLPLSDGEEGVLKLLNTVGAEVYRQTVTGQSVELTIPQITPGMYILRVDAGKQVYSRKVILR
ncbi:MAG: T9SS type A sorting domain-containing protein [Lewinella sp.]